MAGENAVVFIDEDVVGATKRANRCGNFRDFRVGSGARVVGGWDQMPIFRSSTRKSGVLVRGSVFVVAKNDLASLNCGA